MQAPKLQPRCWQRLQLEHQGKALLGIHLPAPAATELRPPRRKQARPPTGGTTQNTRPCSLRCCQRRSVTAAGSDGIPACCRCRDQACRHRSADGPMLRPTDWLGFGNKKKGSDLDARIESGEFGDVGSTKEQLTRPIRKALANDPLGIGALHRTWDPIPGGNNSCSAWPWRMHGHLLLLHPWMQLSGQDSTVAAGISRVP